ncbi:MAG: ABC-type branched-subunit amino acid transport system ATPase component [Glaciecola sp.]|jgi:ABC-type branched-subunit amino acid transport system ATPase component
MTSRRSFQDARLYPGLTVAETIMVAVERRSPAGLVASMLRTRRARSAEAQKREWAGEIISTLGIEPYRDARIGQLSTGTRRVADLAAVIAQQPRIVLLDEPTAGLAQRETEAFGPMLQWIRDQLKCAVLIIEQDMPLVSTVSDRVYALQTGRIIAEGTPDEVLTNPRVIASYLGTDEVAIARSGTRVSKPTPGVPGHEQPLINLTRSQLLEVAASRGVLATSRMRKAELVAAIRGASAL